MSQLISEFSTVDDLKNALLEIGGADPTTVTHHFASGSYVRECKIPAGAVAVGKIHKLESINILLAGEITIKVDNDEPKRMVAPCIFVSGVGSRKAVFAHTDTRFLNVHTSEGDDLAAIERKYICNELEELQ